MKVEATGEWAAQSDEYKEYRALVDKIFERNKDVVEDVAESTDLDPKVVQGILNDDDGETQYAPHTKEQIEMMVRERRNYVEDRGSRSDLITRLRRQLNDPDLLKSVDMSKESPVDTSLLPKVPGSIVEEIADESVDKIHERLHERAQELEDLALSDQELREWTSILDPKGTADDKIAALEVISNEYRLKALREGDLRKETILKNIAETAELKIDLIYLVEKGEAPRHSEARSILESVVEEDESIRDLSRLERIKDWLKKNWLGASALGITVASLLTTIIIGLRSAVKGGASATKSFAKVVRDAIKKLGPWAVGLANFLYGILKGGAVVLGWLASNLWVLVLALAVLLWFAYMTITKKDASAVDET